MEFGHNLADVAKEARDIAIRDGEFNLPYFIVKFCMQEFRLSRQPVTRLLHVDVIVFKDAGVLEEDVLDDLCVFAATATFNLTGTGAKSKMHVDFVPAGPSSNILMTRENYIDAIMVPYVTALMRAFSDRWTAKAKISHLLTNTVYK